MINRFFLVLVAVCLLSGTAPAWAQGISEEAAEVLAAINVLKSDPLSKEARKAMTTVGEYANKETNVMVVVRASYFPELDTVGADNFNLLMASYLAGNMEPQIVNSRTVDHPLQGMKTMLHTYTLLRERGTIHEVPEFEKWKHLGDEEFEILLKKLRASDTLMENPLGVMQ